MLQRRPLQLRGIEHEIAQIGGEDHRHHPGHQQGDADDGEDRKGVLAGTRPRQAHRHETDRGDQRAGQHRKGGRGIGEGRGAEAIPALLHLHHHHLDGDDRIVYEQPEGNHQCAEGNALQIDAEGVHQQEGHRQHQRNRQRDDGAGAQAEADEGNHEDDHHRLGERRHEEVHRLADDLRLVGDDVQVDADRQLPLQAFASGVQPFAEPDHVATAVHRDADADRIVSLHPHARRRWIGKATLDAGDVTEAEEATGGLDADFANVFHRLEVSRDADANAVGRCLVETGGSHRVLPLQGIEDGERVEPERCQLGVRHFDVDLLVLHAEQLDLLHVRQLPQFAADAVGFAAQGGEVETVAGEREDGDEGVAELVVEERADDALRQRVPHVTDLLAHLVPGIGDFLLRRVVLQQHRDQRLAGPRLRAQHVDPRHFLQFLLDALGDLQLHFRRRRSRPQRAHDHRLEGEVRILGAAEPEVREDAGKHQDDDQIGHQRAVAQRPLGEIGRRHRPAGSLAVLVGGAPRRSGCSMARTRSPLLSLCTPATTIRSPAAAPLARIALSSR
ncbi:MAG: hypothetical protein FAZ92_02110 [Accumulibacter sp.]|nr:MAG: hypothetical protein FAZ92_02110 [Accumulibacter sp.]